MTTSPSEEVVIEAYGRRIDSKLKKENTRLHKEVQELKVKVFVISYLWTEHKPGCPKRYKHCRRITGKCSCGLDRWMGP